MAIRYRSKFEADLAGGPLRGVAYEPLNLKYPKVEGRYVPDFVLDNGIVIEAKGKFTAADRAKSLAVRDAHPGIDLRFVFQAPYNRLSPSSLTSYAGWADKKGFKWCSGKDAEVLRAWAKEPARRDSLRAIGWRPEAGKRGTNHEGE